MEWVWISAALSCGGRRVQVAYAYVLGKYVLRCYSGCHIELLNLLSAPGAPFFMPSLCSNLLATLALPLITGFPGPFSQLHGHVCVADSRCYYRLATVTDLRFERISTREGPWAQAVGLYLYFLEWMLVFKDIPVPTILSRTLLRPPFLCLSPTPRHQICARHSAKISLTKSTTLTSHMRSWMSSLFS